MNFPVLNIMWLEHDYVPQFVLGDSKNQAEAFPVATDATSALDHREMYPTTPLTWYTRQKEWARNCNSHKIIICTGFLGAIPCSLQSLLTLCSDLQTQVSLWMDLES